jgi:hypothetical protein
MVMGISFFFHANWFLALKPIFYIAGMSKSIPRDNPRKKRDWGPGDSYTQGGYHMTQLES